MTNVTYTFRESIIKQTRTFNLTDDGIAVSEQEKQLFTIPYQQIRSIRIYYQPQRFRTYNYLCEIKTWNTSYLIKSTSYKSVGNFTDLRETYVPFVRELVNKAVQKNLWVEIYSGNKPATYWFYVLITTVTVVGLAALFMVFPLLGGFSFLFSLVMIGYYLLYSLKMFAKNYPKRITDRIVPDKVLPL